MVENINGRNPSSRQIPEDSIGMRITVETSEIVDASFRPRINGREIDEVLHAFKDSDYSLKKAHKLSPVSKGKKDQETSTMAKIESCAQKILKKSVAYFS
jgi:hypothetical protein